MIQQVADIVDVAEMVNMDVEVDGVATIMSGGKGAKAVEREERWSKERNLRVREIREILE